MTNKPTKNIIQECKILRHSLEVGFLKMAEYLRQIRDERLFESEYESFDDFLLDLKVSKATASKLISIYEYFIVKHQFNGETIAQVGWSNLYEIQKKLPEGIKKSEVKDWIEKGKVLTRDDTTRELNSLVAGEHKHDWYLLKICRVCQERHKVYEE